MKTVLSFALVATFVGCGSKSEEKPSPATTKPQAAEVAATLPNLVYQVPVIVVDGKPAEDIANAPMYIN
jgi:hypothetical protein